MRRLPKLRLLAVHRGAEGLFHVEHGRILYQLVERLVVLRQLVGQVPGIGAGGRIAPLGLGGQRARVFRNPPQPGIQLEIRLEEGLARGGLAQNRVVLFLGNDFEPERTAEGDVRSLGIVVSRLEVIFNHVARMHAQLVQGECAGGLDRLGAVLERELQVERALEGLIVAAQPDDARDRVIIFRLHAHGDANIGRGHGVATGLQHEQPRRAVRQDIELPAFRFGRIQISHVAHGQIERDGLGQHEGAGDGGVWRLRHERHLNRLAAQHRCQVERAGFQGPVTRHAERHPRVLRQGLRLPGQRAGMGRFAGVFGKSR